MPKEIHFYIPPIHDKFVSFTPPPNFVSYINRITDGPCKRVRFSAQISFIYSVWFCMIYLLHVAFHKKSRTQNWKFNKYCNQFEKKEAKMLFELLVLEFIKGICSREPVSNVYIRVGVVMDVWLMMIFAAVMFGFGGILCWKYYQNDAKLALKYCRYSEIFKLLRSHMVVRYKDLQFWNGIQSTLFERKKE